MGYSLDYQSVYRCRQVAVSNWLCSVITGLLLFVALSLKVGVSLKTTKMGYALAKEQNRTIELDMERRALELQRAVISNKMLLARRAQEELGLVPFSPQRIVKLTY